jgi:hypothetical protein
MAAAPMIAQAAQGLATQVANSVAGIFGSNDSAASGQNVPSSGASSPATSAQSASTLSNSVTSQLLQLQDNSSTGKAHHHHHHGAGSYKAASDLASQTDATAQTGSTGAAVTPTTAVTA